MISMLSCGWVPKPWPGAIQSSLMTRRARKCICAGSWYVLKENVWRVLSQPWSAPPRSALGRRVIMSASFLLLSNELIDAEVGLWMQWRLEEPRAGPAQDKTTRAGRPQLHGKVPHSLTVLSVHGLGDFLWRGEDGLGLPGR